MQAIGAEDVCFANMIMAMLSVGTRLAGSPRVSFKACGPPYWIGVSPA